MKETKNPNELDLKKVNSTEFQLNEKSKVV